MNASHTDLGLFILLGSLLIVSPASRTQAQSNLDDLAIVVSGESREFAYTNKATAYLYGETNSSNRNSWMGFNVFGFRFIDDYEILVDGSRLDRSSATKVIVYPDCLERQYPGGIVEQVRMVDSQPLFALVLTSTKPVEFTIQPLISDVIQSHELEIESGDGIVSFARRNHLSRSAESDYPVWVSIYGSGFLPERQDERRGFRYSPVRMSARRSKTRIVSFAVGDTREESELLSRSYHQNSASDLFRQRRSRMERLLNSTFVRTDDTDFNRALAWAKLSLDALIMSQRTTGIFAGLPWFNDYWGRDTFISLPGATLVTGQFEAAKAILTSFASYQQTDSLSTDFGRIPNRVTTTSVGYNTADGTPRFISMAKEYVLRSGDSSFVNEIYPAVIRSIEGTLRYHTDTLGFLVHGDAETWMDAAGPNGPWSPRGNRANDIQALWVDQLEAGVWFATVLGDASSAHRWSVVSKQVRGNFRRHFVNDNLVFDHLDEDGVTDKQIRPNQIFTLPLLDLTTQVSVIGTVVGQLSYSYGVSSLTQDDENYHPYHNHYTYPKDAAYHNGVVWTWLQGPLISALCSIGQQDFAYKITNNSTHQILNRGAVGTQSELLDGVPHPDEAEPRISGTFSQAWNLAEFVRNFYDDYLGVRVERYNHRMYLKPRLPAQLGNVKAIINLNGRGIPVEVLRKEDRVSISIDGKSLRVGGKVIIDMVSPSGRQFITSTTVEPGGQLTWLLQGNEPVVTLNRKDHLHSTRTADAGDLQPLSFASMKLRSDISSLKGPSYPLLSNDDVRKENPAAYLLIKGTDPSGDDNGNGSYVYPRNPSFKEGILDIESLEVLYDDSLSYFTMRFRNLVNPGWHPEYGFQLTYAAIAIDMDRKDSSGVVSVGHNSGFELSTDRAYEKIIFVGGGLLIQDADGNTLAAYEPRETDVNNPIGNIASRSVSFSIPNRVIGVPNGQWRFTVLVGAQDDHGGSGIGVFRDVREMAGEWHGGGKKNSDDPNIYDILETR